MRFFLCFTSHVRIYTYYSLTLGGRPKPLSGFLNIFFAPCVHACTESILESRRHCFNRNKRNETKIFCKNASKDPTLGRQLTSKGEASVPRLSLGSSKSSSSSFFPSSSSSSSSSFLACPLSTLSSLYSKIC